MIHTTKVLQILNNYDYKDMLKAQSLWYYDVNAFNAKTFFEVRLLRDYQMRSNLPKLCFELLSHSRVNPL